MTGGGSHTVLLPSFNLNDRFDRGTSEHTNGHTFSKSVYVPRHASAERAQVKTGSEGAALTW